MGYGCGCCTCRGQCRMSPDASTGDQLTCLVTIHGVGFQHPPVDGSEGYADALHSALSAKLPELSGDPVPEFGRTAGHGAVYVHSDWPPGSGKMDEGLKRLGRWATDDESHRQLDVTDVPLASPGHSRAHVALIYAGLEADLPHPGASIETLAKGIDSHRNYAGLPSIVGIGIR